MSNEHSITINIKQTDDNKTFGVMILKSASVLELKQLCQEISKVPPSHQNLVYNGKILSDNSLLEDLKIEDDHTIILVRTMTQEEKEKKKMNQAPRGTNQPLTNMYGSTNVNPTSLNTNPFGGLTGLGGLVTNDLTGLGGMGNMDMYQTLNMLSDPNYQQMMNSVSLLFTYVLIYLGAFKSFNT